MGLLKKRALITCFGGLGIWLHSSISLNQRDNFELVWIPKFNVCFFRLSNLALMKSCYSLVVGEQSLCKEHKSPFVRLPSRV